MDASEMVIQGATAVVALAALGLAVYEGRETRRHNRLTVRPELRIRQHQRGLKESLGLSVSNDGSGPALINECNIWVDNVATSGWEDAIAKLTFHHHTVGFENITSAVIPPGNRVWLLSAQPKQGDDEAAKRELSHCITRLRVTISYSSLYNERNTANFGAR
jgi:hypothetical protein